MDKEILSEFSIPDTELNAEMLTGDLGSLRLEVEVIGQVDGKTIFRKRGKTVAEGNFKPENAKQMRKRLVEKQDTAEDATDPNDNPEE
jgi:hypothetical protein